MIEILQEFGRAFLYWDGQRWWIAANIWDAERPGLTIPESWIGKFEESSN